MRSDPDAHLAAEKLQCTARGYLAKKRVTAIRVGAATTDPRPSTQDAADPAVDQRTFKAGQGLGEKKKPDLSFTRIELSGHQGSMQDRVIALPEIEVELEKLK